LPGDSKDEHGLDEDRVSTLCGSLFGFFIGR
jgi:hypothetical protein